MDNNGDVVPPALVDEIVRAGGIVRTDAWWVGQSGPTGLLLSDEAIDWIDEVANGETPEPRQTRQSNILNCRRQRGPRGAAADRTRALFSGQAARAC